MLAAASAMVAAKSARLAKKMRRWVDRMTDPYRPELHYMRGPGPKWRAKHGQPETPTGIGELALALRKAGA